MAVSRVVRRILLHPTGEESSDALPLACRHRFHPARPHRRAGGLLPLPTRPEHLRSPLPPHLYPPGAGGDRLQAGPLPRPRLPRPRPHPKPPGRGPAHPALVAHRLGRLLLDGTPPLRPALVHPPTPG